MLSIIIPSYKDPLLHKTIESILSNAVGDFEIIVVLDGYWPEKMLPDDPRIRIVHFSKNRGMREAINAGVRVSRGDLLMRTDEHCMFAERFDIIVASTIQDDWIVTPRRYYLDTEKWEVMDINPVDYGRLVIQQVSDKIQKFTTNTWFERTRKRKHVPIDETMGMQGSCWFMKRKWWDKVIVELQSEGYGTHYQDSHEMVFKTWLAGGKLMVNKNTWYAHRHVSFPRTHQYGVPEATPGWTYSLNKWKNYYESEIKPRWEKKEIEEGDIKTAEEAV